MENIKFEDLNLKKSILKAINDLGYEHPSQIQAEAIPLAIEGYDLIGQDKLVLVKQLLLVVQYLII